MSINRHPHKIKAADNSTLQNTSLVKSSLESLEHLMNLKPNSNLRSPKPYFIAPLIASSLALSLSAAQANPSGNDLSATARQKKYYKFSDKQTITVNKVQATGSGAEIVLSFEHNGGSDEASTLTINGSGDNGNILANGGGKILIGKNLFNGDSITNGLQQTPPSPPSSLQENQMQIANLKLTADTIGNTKSSITLMIKELVLNKEINTKGEQGDANTNITVSDAATIKGGIYAGWGNNATNNLLFQGETKIGEIGDDQQTQAYIRAQSNNSRNHLLFQGNKNTLKLTMISSEGQDQNYNALSFDPSTSSSDTSSSSTIGSTITVGEIKATNGGKNYIGSKLFVKNGTTTASTGTTTDISKASEIKFQDSSNIAEAKVELTADTISAAGNRETKNIINVSKFTVNDKITATGDGGGGISNLITVGQESKISGNIIADGGYNSYNKLLFKGKVTFGEESSKVEIKAEKDNSYNFLKFADSTPSTVPNTGNQLYLSTLSATGSNTSNTKNVLSFDDNSTTSLSIDTITAARGGSNYIGKGLFDTNSSNDNASSLNFTNGSSMQEAKLSLTIKTINASATNNGTAAANTVNVSKLTLTGGITVNGGGSGGAQNLITVGQESKISGSITATGGYTSHNKLLLKGSSTLGGENSKISITASSDSSFNFLKFTDANPQANPTPSTESSPNTGNQLYLSTLSATGSNTSNTKNVLSFDDNSTTSLSIDTITAARGGSNYIGKGLFGTNSSNDNASSLNFTNGSSMQEAKLSLTIKTINASSTNNRTAAANTVNVSKLTLTGGITVDGGGSGGAQNLITVGQESKISGNIIANGGYDSYNKLLFKGKVTFGGESSKIDITANNNYSRNFLKFASTTPPNTENKLHLSSLSVSGSNSQNVLSFDNTENNNNSTNILTTELIKATGGGNNYIGKNLFNGSNGDASSLNFTNGSSMQGAKLSLAAKTVLASGGSNHIFLTKGSFKGNLETSGGNNNIILEDTSWTPLNAESLNTASTDSSSILSGKVTTSGGTTNLVIRVSSQGDSSASLIANTAGKEPAMYSIHTSGGTSNLVLQGQFNLGAYINYGKTGETNLLFANNNEGTDSFASGSSNTDISQDKVLGKTYKDGVKLSLKDKSIQTDDTSTSSFIEKYGHYFEGVSKEGLLTLKSDRKISKDVQSNSGSSQIMLQTDVISVQGLAVGNISELQAKNTDAQTTRYHYDVTLEENSAFVGHISLQENSQVTLTMKKASKLLTDSAQLKLANLKLDGATYHQEQILSSTFEQKNTVIDIASMGSDFASIQRTANKFRLLSIGTDTTGAAGSQPNTGGTQTPSGSRGLTGGSALFRVYVDPTATNGTLGETATQSVAQAGVNSEGIHTYSDRILVFEGDKSTHHLQAIIKTGYDISKVAYHGGGTETKDNIAVATVKGKNGNEVTKFKGAAQIQGFDVVGTTLTSVSGTDKDGRLNGGSGTTGTGEYTTYFIEKMVSRGASMANQLASSAAMGVNYELFIANLNSLNKRMGELRDNAYTQGAWGRIFNGMQTSNFSLKTRSIYTTIQAGYDYGFALEGAKNVLGLALSYANSFSHAKAKDVDLDGEFKGIDQATSHAVEIALYNAYVQDGASKESRWANGFYSDSILKLSYITSNLSITGEKHSYSTANLAASIGEEIGYRFLLGEKQSFYIDPQIEVTFGYLNQSNLKRKLGAAWAQSVQEHVITVRNRVGASYGYKFDEFTQEDLKASLYLGTYYTYDYITGGSVKITTDLGKVTHLDPLISTSRFTLNLGSNLAIKDNTRVYFDFERSFGGKITTDYQVNLGVRYGFGEKKQIPLKIKQTQQTTQEQKKAPLKLEKNTKNLSKEGNKS